MSQTPAGFYKDYEYQFLSTSEVDSIDSNIAMPGGQAISQRFDTGSVIRYVNKTLTFAQMRALRATPITIIPSPGVGFAIQYLSAFLALQYNSTAYTISNSTDYMNFRYASSSGAIVSDNIVPTGFLSATASTYTSSRAKVDGIVAASVAGNAPLVLHNSGAAEYSAGNSSVQVRVAYIIQPIGF